MVSLSGCWRSVAIAPPTCRRSSVLSITTPYSTTRRRACRVIVDRSALVAILRGEDDAAAYTDAIEEAAQCRISAARFLETAIVIDSSRNLIASRRLDVVVRESGSAYDRLTGALAHIACQAHRDLARCSG